MNKDVKILDCTLRDGGYYTEWDFEDSIVDTYVKNIAKLPIDVIEIGYLSQPQNKYLGKYFYCPEYTLKQIKSGVGDKKVAIMLNERDNTPQDAMFLLYGYSGFIDIVRLAVDPNRIKPAVELAKAIKELGFEVGFNLMYMSKVVKQPETLEQLSLLNGIVDYFSLVDSFGGVYPNEVFDAVNKVKEILNMPIGFHGHNNLEMALINSLTAVEAGAEIIDATFTGMGRGAGNLKTELLLTVLNSNGTIDLNYNALSEVVASFTELQHKYNWGTNLPYMVSGANSLPQKDVMEWVSKNRYSLGTIINALQNQKDNVVDNLKRPFFNRQFENINRAIVIGGGKSSIDNVMAVRALVEKNEGYCLIHSSSRNAKPYQDISVPQFYCLVGNEGYRLASIFNDLTSLEHICVLPPYPRKMGTYIPEQIIDKTFELEAISFIDKFSDSPLTLAIQIALDLKIQDLYFIGFDGYNSSINQAQYEVALENQEIFDQVAKLNFTNTAFLSPTKYKGLKKDSVYGYLKSLV